MRRFRVRPGLDGKLAGINERRGRYADAMGVISGIDGLRVGERALAFWGLGQVGVAIKGPEGVLYVDPYLTDSDGEGGSLERTFPPPLRPDEVTNADAVFLTHDHIDHTDSETVLPLSEASPQARFVAPSTSRDTLVGAGLDAGRVVVPEVG
ncbi:MAG: MBL fold metallo-hydrolase, partial [Rubrobacter sp.]|nr:MBL fold metallo-hydrolase [Rubrobacter sp.]